MFKDRARKTMTKVKGWDFVVVEQTETHRHVIMLTQLSLLSLACSVYDLQSAQGPITSQLSLQYPQQEVDTRQFTPSTWDTL